MEIFVDRDPEYRAGWAARNSRRPLLFFTDKPGARGSLTHESRSRPSMSVRGFETSFSARGSCRTRRRAERPTTLLRREGDVVRVGHRGDFLP